MSEKLAYRRMSNRLSCTHPPRPAWGMDDRARHNPHDSMLLFIAGPLIADGITRMPFYLIG